MANTRPVRHSDDWQSSHYASIFEFTQIVGKRCTQIQNGWPAYVETTDADTFEDIALREIAEKKCPLSVVRTVGLMLEVIPMNSLVSPISIDARHFSQ
jgi:DNA-directed RNA polymerase subunit K/omega